MSSKIENLIKNRYGWCHFSPDTHQPIMALLSLIETIKFNI